MIIILLIVLAILATSLVPYLILVLAKIMFDLAGDIVDRDFKKNQH